MIGIRLHRPLAVAALWMVLSGAQAQVIDAPDSDGDGVNDARDKCQRIANPYQRDSTADGFGNVCDMDLNNDGIVNVADLGLLRLAFFSSDPDADANGDGTVNEVDLGFLPTQFFEPPGPTRFVSFVGELLGAWDDPSNWRPARRPDESDHVLFSNSVSLTIVSSDVSIASLEVCSTELQASGTGFHVATQLVVTDGSLLFVRDVFLTAGLKLDVKARDGVGPSNILCLAKTETLGRLKAGGPRRHRVERRVQHGAGPRDV